MKSALIIIAIGLCLISRSGAQTELTAVSDSLQHWEKQVQTMEESVDQRKLQLDSLRHSGADSETLARFTAVTFDLTRNLQRARAHVISLQKTKAKLQTALYNRYSQKIDSLLQTPVGTERDRQLLDLLGKQLKVSPLARRLKFNPMRLSAIDTANQDSLAQEIYMDYLKQAANELADEIDLITSKEQQFRELAALESKAGVFMEEVEGSQMLAPAANQNENKSLGLDYSESAGASRNLMTANQQAGSFFHLFEGTSKVNEAVLKEPLSYDQLVQKLESSRRQLEIYWHQVQRKLSQLQNRP